jgi:ABC-type transporter Mla subunit MlaD
MSKQRNAVKVGTFILLSVALIFTLVVAINRGAGMFSSAQVRYASFTLADDLSGLRVGDDVRIGGFTVGEVRSIQLVAPDHPKLPRRPASVQPPPSAMILVEFSVPKKYKLYDDARIGIQTTFTGQSWLNFDHIGSGAELVNDAPALIGRPSPFNAILASAPQLADQLNMTISDVRLQTIPRVNGILEDVRGQTVPKVNQTVDGFKDTADTATALITDVRGEVKPAVEKYHAVTDSANRMLANIGDVFGESKTDMKGTFTNLNAVTGSVKEKLPGILEKVDAAMAKMDSAVVNAAASLENIRNMTGSANSVISGNKSRLDGMIASLKATGDNLKYASAEIRRSPWRLLYKPPKNEVANLNIFDSARQFAEGANDLNDAAQALKDAVNSNAPEDDVKKLMERVEKSFTNFADVEKRLWAEVKE